MNWPGACVPTISAGSLGVRCFCGAGCRTAAGMPPHAGEVLSVTKLVEVPLPVKVLAGF